MALAVAAIVVGTLVRFTSFWWDSPWSPHHPDEHILPLEALALWEGITPREVGWPASTTRLILSGAAAASWALEEGPAWLPHADMNENALTAIAHWIGVQYVNPIRLYQIGRVLSIVTGVLQLLALVWALGQWMGPRGAAVGTFAAAIAPLHVLHSQYILADITGLLFATILVGLAVRVTPVRMIAMGTCAGLAAASKFHFGIWLLAPLLGACIRTDLPWRRRCGLMLLAVVACAWVIITLVPWLWTNPLLAAKELAGVVGVKMGGGSSVQNVIDHAAMLFGGLGAMTWGGAVVGAVIARDTLGRTSPVVMPTVAGALVLAVSAIVFDRYWLAVMPGLLVLAGLGWGRWLGAERRIARSGAFIALTACAVLTVSHLVTDERRAAESDPDALAREWVLAHVARGSRVALHHETNAFLPRTRAQLSSCAEWVGTPEAYRKKWELLGVASGPTGSEPMRTMVLNDELFNAHWCRRELQVQTDPGYDVVTYHREPRFGAMLESEAIRNFQAGSHEPAGGVDVLIVNRPVAVNVPPSAVLQTRRGQRVIYIQRTGVR
jgi:hypothetical protein